MRRRTYYQTLGLRPGCDPAAVDKAFRRCARQWHPDLNPSAEALERFYEAQRAYQALSNPVAREGYNMLLSLDQPRGSRRPLPVMMSRRRPRRRRRIGLALGVMIAMNLALLGYGAYAVVTLLDAHAPRHQSGPEPAKVGDADMGLVGPAAEY